MNLDSIQLVLLFTLCAVICASIQYCLLRFTHWSLALGATTLMALIVSYLYVSLNTSNLNLDTSEYITLTLVVFTSLLLELFLVAKLSQNYVTKKALVLSLVFIILFTSSRYVYQYISSIKVYSSVFSSCDIEVLNEAQDLEMKEIGFQNSFYGLLTTIDPNERYQSLSYIPKATNKITFRFFSVKKNQMISQDFPFDYSLCKETEGKRVGLYFWLKEKVVLPIKIIFRPKGIVNLYIANQFAQKYQLNDDDFMSFKAKYKGKYP